MDMDTAIRTARYRGRVPDDTEAASALKDNIDRYLPRGYTSVLTAGELLLVGKDEAGWTMDGYVLPRLASGLHWFSEVRPPQVDRQLSPAERRWAELTEGDPSNEEAETMLRSGPEARG